MTTYIDKLMTAVKFDGELLTEGEKEFLSDKFRCSVMDDVCPGDFWMLMKRGAPSEGNDTCPDAPGVDCRTCWESELDD